MRIITNYIQKNRNELIKALFTSIHSQMLKVDINWQRGKKENKEYSSCTEDARIVLHHVAVAATDASYKQRANNRCLIKNLIHLISETKTTTATKLVGVDYSRCCCRCCCKISMMPSFKVISSRNESNSNEQNKQSNAHGSNDIECA